MSQGQRSGKGQCVPKTQVDRWTGIHRNKARKLGADQALCIRNASERPGWWSARREVSAHSPFSPRSPFLSLSLSRYLPLFLPLLFLLFFPFSPVPPTPSLCDPLLAPSISFPSLWLTAYYPLCSPAFISPAPTIFHSWFLFQLFLLILLSIYPSAIQCFTPGCPCPFDSCLRPSAPPRGSLPRLHLRPDLSDTPLLCVHCCHSLQQKPAFLSLWLGRWHLDSRHRTQRQDLFFPPAALNGTVPWKGSGWPALASMLLLDRSRWPG